jgi:Xaa-Pro aminopeptidase
VKAFPIIESPFGTAESSVAAEVAAKVAQVRALLADLGAPAAVLTSSGTVAWLTAGLTNRIEAGSPTSAMWLVITSSDACALTTNVERPRIEAEHDLHERGLRLEDVEWFAGDGGFVRAACECAGAPATALASDGHEAFGLDAEDALAGLRLALLPAERVRLAGLALAAAAALEHALLAWRPGERDFDLQARAAAHLEQAGAFGACLIVGGDDRVERFRHPLAIGAPVTRLAMAVVVAERGGLHAAATRMACSGRLPDSVRAAWRAAGAVEARMLAACRVGATYGDVMSACDDAYAEAGHRGAWREHYQGGPIAYRQREFEIVPGQRDSAWYDQRIEAGHAVAWNPSVAGGGKVEDTFLIEDGGLRCLTETGGWPQVVVAESRARSAILDIATGAAA